MKLEKAIKILENARLEKNVEKAVSTVLDHEIKQFHRLHFAQAYLEGMEVLTAEDVKILREGIS